MRHNGALVAMRQALEQTQEIRRQLAGSLRASGQEQSRLDQLQLHQSQSHRTGQNINPAEWKFSTPGRLKYLGCKRNLRLFSCMIKFRRVRRVPGVEWYATDSV